MEIPSQFTLRAAYRKARTLVERVHSAWLRRRYGLEVERWKTRARKFGRRAVFNLAHDESTLAAVTAKQRAELFPVLRERLGPADRVILDLGCGTGRFTPDLATMVSGQAIGLDPIDELLALAPRRTNVRYARMKPGTIPLPAASIDVAFICLVLGGIKGDTLASTVREIDRVLRPSGLLFLVENTAEGPDSEYWYFRSTAEYRRLFPSIALEAVHAYEDVGQRISVMTGRKA